MVHGNLGGPDPVQSAKEGSPSEVFNQSDVFRPERLKLSKNKSTCYMEEKNQEIFNFELIPFGSGSWKRICAGLVFAIRMVSVHVSSEPDAPLVQLEMYSFFSFLFSSLF